MVSFDKAVGLYHFLGDKVPKNIPLVEPKPRTSNRWCRDGRALVAKVRAGESIRAAIDRAIGLLGGLGNAVSRGDKVLIKPNFNSPDPFPASTDLEFLRATIEMLLELGVRVVIGESAGGVWRPTRNVFRKAGVDKMARSLNVELVALEDRTDWVKVKVDGDYLGAIAMPRLAYESDKLIYLPCMKTHRLAWYSGALKLAFGFVHPGERRAFHLSHLQQKVAEVNLCWQPDLILMDGRKAFVTGGPDQGELVEPGVLLASGDLIATDVEAIKVLLTYPTRNKLPANPWKLPQIVTARKHRLGADSYDVIEERCSL